ncbi:hypothetical protein Sinac_4938 [Singulisphaera acidiphila DSM 18658]|uniref:Uncharacterized protein n=1 Tax=Singulisphaera acidiphila (strain ATCC BAA-1392 / DSM 18658 / VKM B-2454 / MOB10) TaxID=886293 RepID=L0DI72_SINAD|nr:hypothetical protein Sinac_4938 [Singulisphaera acidiphila DSM 18658]
MAKRNSALKALELRFLKTTFPGSDDLMMKNLFPKPPTPRNRLRRLRRHIDFWRYSRE